MHFCHSEPKPPSVREVARSAGGSRGVKKTCRWHVFSLRSRRLCRRSIHLGLHRTILNSLPQSRLRAPAPSQRGPWVPCIHSSRNEPMGPCHPYRLLTKVGRSAERNILIPTIPQKLPFYSRTMANVRHITSAAPAAFKTRAHSPSVAPVVQISSTSSKRFPANCSGDTAS